METGDQGLTIFTRNQIIILPVMLQEWYYYRLTVSPIVITS